MLLLNLFVVWILRKVFQHFLFSNRTATTLQAEWKAEMNSVSVKVLVVLQLLGAAVVVVAAVAAETPARLLPTVLSEAQIYTDTDSGSENGDSQQRRSTNNGKSNSKAAKAATEPAEAEAETETLVESLTDRATATATATRVKK